MNKYIIITKILIKKHVISRPLNSIAFKGSQLIDYVMPRCEHYDYCYSYVINGMILCLKKYDSKKSTNMNNCIKIKKIKKTTRDIKAIKFNSFQRNPTNTLRYVSM